MADGEASFDEYDHEYEPKTQCTNCKKAHEDCECESYVPEDIDGSDCAQCDLPEGDPTHG